MAALKTSGQQRNVKVLLAEDESMIRELIATFLTNLGFTVIEAENGRESLEKAKQLGLENVGLLITDLVMPVMGGLELAAELRKLQPDMRVLFISGYTDDVVILGNQARSNTAFLKKPFNFDTLRSRIEALIAPNETASQAKA
jgi:two-component system, cell cycle sensor histidine kinase and response regulator CckA